ncbi:MAG: YhbY family RNA-binding protein [Clostridia bacterium]|nr:YhbY family RNA-binding protein [Clostridia bacterium]
MNSKQRAKLKGMASTMPAIFQIGKGEISDNLLAGLDSALTARELIKISVLKNCDYDAEDVMRVLEMKLHAEAVCKIGNKIVLYRYSEKDGVKHIEL